MRTLRCQCVGIFVGLSLALGVATANDWRASAPAPSVTSAAMVQDGQVLTLKGDEPHPTPVPLLLLAVSLFAVAATLRWRRR